MKNCVNICKLLIVVTGLMVFANCARVDKSTIGSEEGRSGQTTDGRGFNPLELPQDRIVVPRQFPRTGAISTTILSDGDGAVDVDSMAGIYHSVPNEIDTFNGQAYRIQIFTTQLYGEAQRSVRVAREIFDRPIFVDYEVPYFKVRVGSFADREAAEEYQQRVKGAGYKTAWVVMVNVNVKSAKPLYDEFLPFEFEDSIYVDDSDADPDE